MSESVKTKTIFVSICGKPNVGKSSLLNKLLQENLSVVTYKAQTTRNAIRGILTKGDVQIVFTDTPGIMKDPKDNLQAVIKKNAYSGVRGADLAIFVVDAESGFAQGMIDLATTIKGHVGKMICVINKIDRVKENQKKYEMAQNAFNSELFEEIFPISVLNGDNLDLLEQYIISQAKEGVWHYDPEDITDRPNVFVASEITRGIIFEKTKEEVPYGVDIFTPVFTFHDGFIEIMQDIICIRESQKGILIGEHGKMVKSIRLEAEKRLSEFYHLPIKLELMVKVREDWIKKLVEER